MSMAVGDGVATIDHRASDPVPVGRRRAARGVARSAGVQAAHREELSDGAAANPGCLESTRSCPCKHSPRPVAPCRAGAGRTGPGA